MDKTWEVLTRYKLLEERVNSLRSQANQGFPMSGDVNRLLYEAEAELKKLKVWIDINYKAKKWD